MGEQIADLGYCAIGKESTKGTAVTPSIYLPIYNETIMEDAGLQSIDAIMGLKAERFKTLRGQRKFKGAIDFLGEPNVAGYIFDMILNKVSTSGSGPYTHVFGLNTTNPHAYSVDIARGRMVFRFYGLEASEVASKFEQNRMHLPTKVTSLGCFGPREITDNTTGVLTLSTQYDPTPTKGLVASDLVRLFKADGTVVDTTVTSFTATTVTVASASGVAAGDIMTLRPATSSFTLSGEFFQFARSEYRISDSISNALSATHTPVEPGSDWKITHKMLPDDGTLRSGAYNPVSIVRGKGDIELKTKIYFDTPDQKNRFYMQSNRAIIMRHFAGITNQYELRVTADQLVQKGNPTNLKVGEVLFDDIDWMSEYNSSNGKNYGVTVINGVSSI